jgi:hypothetical protein
MTGLKAFRKTMAVLGFACIFAVGVCWLPASAYQRWQLLDGTDYETLRWTYERIHFDPRPVDIAIVGPSKTLNGLSAARIEQRLSELGEPVDVANFSLVADGRNANWAIVSELYKTKSPKLIIVGIDDAPFPYGHPAFKYFAPTSAIVSPPQPLLHDYFYDLAYLPYREAKLFGAWLFPGLAGLTKTFNPQDYVRTRSDFTSTFTVNGRTLDMDRVIPRNVLLAEAHLPEKTSVAARALSLFNEGDDHVYIREIARLAKLHGSRLLFVFLPTFNGSEEVADRAFLEQFGRVLSEGDMAQRDELYMNWVHFNHAGAMIASDRLAKAIAGLEANKGP